jgi:DNA repair ATPase RecN
LALWQCGDVGLALQVTTDMQRQEFREALNKKEEWLYEDEANSASSELLYFHIMELQKMGDPIRGRVRELERRPARVQAATELTDLISKATNSWPETKPWLNSTLVEELKQLVRFLSD